ncbi:MAG: hypothetical protein KC572_07115 [Gammaproteobacteria bacterium]|nr:hypothetical protein [Gammaproteobacteria bacterium]
MHVSDSDDPFHTIRAPVTGMGSGRQKRWQEKDNYRIAQGYKHVPMSVGYGSFSVVAVLDFDHLSRRQINKNDDAASTFLLLALTLGTTASSATTAVNAAPLFTSNDLLDATETQLQEIIRQGQRVCRLEKDDENTEFAFVIEHRTQVARRIGLKVNATPSTEVRFLDGPHTHLSSLHQFLIGNTDFSPIRAAPGETCCHNYVLFGAKEGIYDLVTSNESCRQKTHKETLRFLDGFYQIIESPKLVQSQLVSKCVGPD